VKQVDIIELHNVQLLARSPKRPSKDWEPRHQGLVLSSSLWWVKSDKASLGKALKSLLYFPGIW